LEFGGDADERAELLQAARDSGVLVLELPGRVWDPVAIPELIRVRAAISRFRPDVIHVHDSVDPRALALLPRAPLVLSIHDPSPHPGQPVARRVLRRWFLGAVRERWRKRARVVVIHSERLRGEVPLRQGQVCAVLDHGLEVRDEPLAPPPVPTVGFFGRLEPYKGLDVLARAMPRVWQVRPEVQLNVAGSGLTPFPLKDPRISIKREYLPESKLDEFFGGISLAALPYTHASQSGAGSLAVARGVPIIASRLGGLPDLTLDETYLFDPGDEAGLAAAIVRHLDDDATVRRRVLTEVAGPRSWHAVAQRSLEVYDRLLATP
jgi:glycosyltransferase involved in cell wall biosynthesis